VSDSLSGSLEDFQTAFWQAKKAMVEANEAAFRRHGLYTGQQFILRALAEEDGLSPGELADRLCLATPTVTRAATRMEAAGLLVRRPHPTDARLVRLHLTERGRELRSVIEEEMQRVSEHALATLAPSERAALVRYLTVMRQNLVGPDGKRQVRPAMKTS
jgi:MarR family transcriptional regulator, organic hydroperoxide resistance regulator